jgi:hypothetical protein
MLVTMLIVFPVDSVEAKLLGIGALGKGTT